MTSFEIFELGDHALVATALGSVSFETQQRIWQLADVARGWPEVEEAIPGMNNLTLVFDPLSTPIDALRRKLERLYTPVGPDAKRGAQAGAKPETGIEADAEADPETGAETDAEAGPEADAEASAGIEASADAAADAVEDSDQDGDAVMAVAPPPPGRLVEIPVHYGGSDGPDIDAVAKHTGLSVDALIERHSAAEYTVYFLGFQPGFAYLGGLDPALATPRRKDPRVTVPAGSVGIGGEQTGVYPTASPGGWQLIGRTSAVLFDPNRDPPSLLEPGDRVRFVPAGGAR